jgi:hypothetical protein
MKTKFRSVFETDTVEWLPQIRIAPQGAWYVEFDYDGKPTGIWASASAGDRLPTISPQGYTWRLAQQAMAECALPRRALPPYEAASTT